MSVQIVTIIITGEETTSFEVSCSDTTTLLDIFDDNNIPLNSMIWVVDSIDMLYTPVHYLHYTLPDIMLWDPTNLEYLPCIYIEI